MYLGHLHYSPHTPAGGRPLPACLLDEGGRTQRTLVRTTPHTAHRAFRALHTRFTPTLPFCRGLRCPAFCLCTAPRHMPLYTLFLPRHYLPHYTAPAGGTLRSTHAPAPPLRTLPTSLTTCSIN